MSDIQSFLKELKIKEVLIGGFEKEAVYSAMQELASMYQKEIGKLKAEKEQLESEYKTAVNELAQANHEVQLLKFQLEEGQKSQSKYEVRFNALTQAIDAVNANKEEVIEESKRAAEGIIAEANERYKSISQECLFQKQQMDLVLSRISDAKQRFRGSMENFRSTLTKMLSEVDALQKNGLGQELSGDEMNHLVPKTAGSASEYDGR